MTVPASAARRGILAICAAAVLWASIGIGVRLFQDAGLGSIPILFWRLVFASAVLALMVGRQGARSLIAECRRPGRLLVVSVTALGFQLTYFYAVADVGVAISTLVTLGVAPLAAVLHESLAARRRPAPRTLVALVFALAGLTLVSLARTTVTVAPHPGWGVAFSVASGLLYAASAQVSRRLGSRLSPQALTAGTTVIGVILLLPVALAVGPSVPITPAVIGGLAYLGVVTSAIAYVLFYYGLRTTSGAVAMVLTLLEPATAVVLAALLLAEPIGLASGSGTVLVLVAVAVLYAGPTSQS